jgi:Ca2+-binding RTX toxin-like protein
VEGVIGSHSGDSITGNSGNNDLRGQDTTDNASGSDTIIGISGNDNIDARGGKPDTVLCGPGIDTAKFDLVDTLPSDCENMSQAAVGQHPNVDIGARVQVVRHGTALRVRLKCPKKSRRRCKGSLTLRDRAGRRLGRKHFSIRRGRGRRLTVGLNPRGRRAVAAHQRTTAVAKEKDTNGKPKTTIARLELR